MMIKANENFGGTFPFKPNYCEAFGFKMHYVDEGKGEVILCIHGEPTWGYLYRLMTPLLSKSHRVIVPDNMVDLVEYLGLNDITLVVHDWGGPMGAGLFKSNPNLIKRIVIMNTLFPLGT